MGNNTSTWLGSTPQRKKFKIFLGGLDAAGKTTLLYKLANDRKVETQIPTIGFVVDSCEMEGFYFTSWDSGGRNRVRPLWRRMFQDVEAVVWIIDSGWRLEETLDELKLTMNDEKLGKGLPLLLLCNKQDLPNAMSPEAIVKRLGGTSHPFDGDFLAVGCVATQEKNIREGFDWLYNILSKPMPQCEKNTGESDKTLQDLKQESPSSPTLDFKTTFEGGNATLMNFSPIKNGTPCPFAKTATLWGGKPFFDEPVSLEIQAKANVTALTEFCRRVRANNREPLDGFCVELQDVLATKGSPKDVGTCVRRVMTVLSDLDPAMEHCIRVGYIGNPGWRFRFAKVDFFLTTFAPCYPISSSRHSFDTGRAFLLLQPEDSFARHKLPFDTPNTSWESPKTVRDKTRVAFRDAGQSYHIPVTTNYPQSEHIVKPLKDDGTTVERWWEEK